MIDVVCSSGLMRGEQFSLKVTDAEQPNASAVEVAMFRIFPMI
jgi:hypothetical protein